MMSQISVIKIYTTYDMKSDEVAIESGKGMKVKVLK